MSHNNIEEIVKSSGNTFHYRVIQFLRESGWSVLISPFYNDNLTDKPREIDIIAEKEFDVNTLGGWEGTLNIKLFIECKYISQPTVFWFDKKDDQKAIRKIMSDTGLGHPDNNVSIKKHRFYELKEVAKLFASGKENQEKELMYKAINQSLNAMIYFKNDRTIIPVDPNGKVKRVLKTVAYPLILCNSFSDFYKIDANDIEKPPVQMKNNFNLEVNYAYLDKDKEQKTGYFLIDVVNFDKLSDYLINLKNTDIDTITQQMSYALRSRR